MSRRFALVPLALAVVWSAPASAGAACVTSTPASVTYADHPADGDSGLAPEIGVVGASVDGGCTYAVDPGISPPFLIEDDGVFVYLDTDGNLSTGDPVFTGADAVVGTVGTADGTTPPRLARWNGATYDFAGGVDLPAPFAGGFRAGIDQLAVPSGATTRLRVGTIWTGTYDSYFDFAPDAPGSTIALPVTFGTAAPPPPAPAPAPPATAPSTAPLTAPSTAAADEVVETTSCRVPRVRGLTPVRAEDKLVAAGCDLAATDRSRFHAKVRRGRVIATQPAAGRRTSRPVRLIISKGRKARRKKRSAARMSTSSISVLARAQQRMRLGERVAQP